VTPHLFLQDLALVLCAAALTTIACQKLRLPVVLGYLVAGIIVGPHTPIPFFAHDETVRTLAELGVILLMFSLGLEFNLRTLARIIPTGGVVAIIEVGLTFALGFQVAASAGLDTSTSLLAGALVSISSTMIVSHAFQDLRFEKRAREAVFGILIAEDLVAILMLATVSALAAGTGDTGNILKATAGRLVLVVAALLGGGLLIVPPLFRAIVALRRKETLLVTSVGFCFALALFAQSQGLSVALGAFLAGALISEAGVARHVEPLVEPLRDMFTGIFFVSIGMLFDPAGALRDWGLVLALTAVVLVGKSVGVTVGSFLSGQPVRTAVQAGMSLTQIGEFSFVIATIGAGLSAGAGRLFSVAVAVAMLTAFTTPLLMGRSERIALKVDATLPRPLQTFVSLYGSWVELLRQPRAVSAWSLVRHGLALLVLYAVALGAIVIASAVNLPTLEAWFGQQFSLGADAASMVVILGTALVSLPFAVLMVRAGREIAERLAARALPPPAKGVDQGRAPRRTLVLALQVGALLAVGLLVVAVTQPFLPRLSAPALIVLVMLFLGIAFWRAAKDLQGHMRAGAEVAAHMLTAEHRRFDTGDAALLQVEKLLPGIGSLSAVTVEPGGPADKRTLAELNLRGLTGATVVAVSRGDRPLIYPSGRVQLEAGDVLALSGTTEAISAASERLSGSTM
jgi:CPA2 family monovalent cation:H+ antiporter-2